MRQKMRIWMWICGMLVICPHLHAQMVFKVMARQGDVKVIHGSQVLAAPVGYQLVAGDQLNVPDKGYIALMHKSGSSYTLKKGGVYKVSDLDAEVVKGNKSGITRFGDYIASEMGKAGQGKSVNDYRKNMSTTASVDRALLNGDVVIVTPRSSKLAYSGVTLTWLSVPQAESYRVDFTDRFGGIIQSFQLKDTVLVVDLADMGIKSGESAFYQVYAVSDNEIKSMEYMLTRLGDEPGAAIQDTSAAILGEDPEAVDYLVLAGYFEQQGLLSDAKVAYEKAMEMEPEVGDFRKAYELFLIRNGLERLVSW